jgi:uncharacterized protein YcfL
MKWTLAGVVLGLTLIAGCSSSNAPITARQETYPRHQVHLVDAELRGKTMVGNPETYREDGLLYVIVPVRSTTDRNLHIDYRFMFFDEHGRPIEPMTKWLGGKTLPAHTPDQIMFNSTSANAADFQLDIRWAR